MTKLTDKQFKQLQKKLFEYVDDMNIDQLKHDLKRYMLEDYSNQPTWKLVSDKLIEFDLMEEEKEFAWWVVSKQWKNTLKLLVMNNF